MKVGQTQPLAGLSKSTSPQTIAVASPNRIPEYARSSIRSAPGFALRWLSARPSLSRIAATSCWNCSRLGTLILACLMGRRLMCAAGLSRRNPLSTA